MFKLVNDSDSKAVKDGNINKEYIISKDGYRDGYRHRINSGSVIIKLNII